MRNLPVKSIVDASVMSCALWNVTVPLSSAKSAEPPSGVREGRGVFRECRGPFAAAGEHAILLPVIREMSGRAAAQAGLFDTPIVEEFLERDAVVAKIDVHRIRLGVRRQCVMRGDVSAAVRGTLYVDDRAVAGDVHRAVHVGEVVNVGADLRRQPAAGQRHRAAFAFQRAVEIDDPVERFVDFENLADAIESDLRGEVQVVRGLAQRCDAAVGEDAQVVAAFERK